MYDQTSWNVCNWDGNGGKGLHCVYICGEKILQVNKVRFGWHVNACLSQHWSFEGIN